MQYQLEKKLNLFYKLIHYKKFSLNTSEKQKITSVMVPEEVKPS